MLPSETSEKFRNLFTQTLNLTDAEFRCFVGHFDRKYLDKKQHYLREGEVTRYKAYITKGCTRSYVLDAQGKEHIHFFAFEDWWIGDIESYYTQKPGKLYVQALEDTELMVISRDDFSKLEQAFPKLQQWYFVKVQKTQFATINRLNEVKISSPQERYEALLAKHPDVLQRVPLQYIAAYLDMEPQSFSRMRNRIMQNNKS